MKPIDERTPKDVAANQKVYNRPESDHRKVEPYSYPQGVNWTEVHRAIQRGNARAKKQEKP